MKRLVTLSLAIWHALVYLFAGRPVLAPDVIARHRKATCKPCKYNQRDWCRRCGCYWPVKAQIASEQCPDTPPRWKSC